MGPLPPPHNPTTKGLIPGTAEVTQIHLPVTPFPVEKTGNNHVMKGNRFPYTCSRGRKDLRPEGQIGANQGEGQEGGAVGRGGHPWEAAQCALDPEEGP